MSGTQGFLWRSARRFTRGVDALNAWVGQFAMWLLVLMLAVLVWGIASQAIDVRSVWVIEMAQFTLVSYYLLGGAWTMQRGVHVRMDVFYSRWQPRTRSVVDSLTSVFLIFFLVMLVVGGGESTAYALETEQPSPSLWRHDLARVNNIMTTGMALMLLQSLSELCKDIARAVGHPIDTAN
jgi:TRAP-type mannitol/chloroaromatic compound transport system permease small subunit